jgi:tRNA A-37 threonylcarbamoyl transferase component Bud32
MSARSTRLGQKKKKKKRKKKADACTQDPMDGRGIGIWISVAILHNNGLVHFPLPTQNISSYTHHIKSFDACMEH